MRWGGRLREKQRVKEAKWWDEKGKECYRLRTNKTALKREGCDRLNELFEEKRSKGYFS